MKKKIFAALTVMFALSLALTVYAFNQSASSVSVKTAAGCCAKKDSCPMKNKEAKAENASCCDKPDCCCKGDSCPMRMNGEKISEGKECCCKGGTCPMKKSDENQPASAVLRIETLAAKSVN